METRASYILVGTFVLGLVAAAIVFVMWKAGRTEGKQVTYHVLLAGNATGLATGTLVRYRGIQKGVVVKLEPRKTRPHDLERFGDWAQLKGKDEVIDVEIKVRDDTPVYTDTVATIESQGLTGAPFIQLTRKFTAGATQLKPDDAEKSIIRGDTSGFDAVLEAAPEALKSIRDLADEAKKLLGDNRDKVGKLFDGANDALKSIDSLAAEAKKAVQKLEAPIKTLDDVGRDAQKTLRSFEAAGTEVRGLLVDARAMLRENRRPLADFAATGLYEFSLFLTDMRKFVRSFDRILTRLESDPSQFLFGNRQRGFETQGR
jgi:phospholipid/cholesterol/gamma-HCH transport system substrate-binding protein